MTLVFLFLSAVFLAYSNGANDNFKGVATLFGSDTISYKGAIIWASITTLAGSLAAIFLATSLVKSFSGKGLVSDELIQNPYFMISITFGAALTVFLATKIGMPISTTHALVGALLGTGFISVGMSFNFSKLGSTFLFPLIASPILAAVVSMVVYIVFRALRIKSGITKDSCFCVGETEKQLELQRSVAFSVSDSSTNLLATETECKEFYSGNFLGLNVQKILNFAHYLSAGVVGFSRGLNDTPKIAGLLLVISALDVQYSIMAIALAILTGGLLNAKKGISYIFWGLGKKFFQSE